jgi:D-xylose transport system substrate-binding protein
MFNRRNAVSALAAAALAVTGFVATTPAHAAAGFVGVILPDAASSNRWESADRPFLTKAFAAAGVAVKIQNANGDKAAFATIADQMLTQGAKVLVTVNLDSASSKAVQDKAKKQGVPTIDYDRLTLGGSESYYVSFDNVAVGVLQGTGIVNCLKAKNVKNPRIVYLNGSPTDNNATLFAQGYKSVVNPYLKANGGTAVADQAVPNWDNVQGGTIFEQMLTKAGKKLDAVVSANEGLGLAAVAVLKKNGLNGKVCVSGQDASDAGLAAILTGDLSNTVYKAVKQEAEATAALAVALFKGQKATTAKGMTNAGTSTAALTGTNNIPSVLLVPVGITKANVSAVTADGYTTRAKICAIATEAVCKANKF